ncbi:histone H1-II-like [Aphis craccivora]|uniref:Histone H1-II-like n=1 Tax=Aphis craccivora TaxID=307492 RepID=A0A6G0VQU8_APHCR|nr:histone H1-II-like [Aphis craccivora]
MYHVNVRFFFVNGRKIFYVFDVPHLLKSTRNIFFKYQLTFLNSTTSKKHLVDFFESDQGLNRLAPKLTEVHINPGPFQKMKVKLANKIFSKTVAAGMKCCVQGGTLPSTANATITFIEHMDKLFDLLNSKKKGIWK